VLSLAILAAPSTTRADISLFADYDAWAAQAGANQRTIYFEGLSNKDGYAYDIGNIPDAYADFSATGLTTGGLRFTSPANGMYTVNPRWNSHTDMPDGGGYDFGTGDVLSIQGGSAVKELTATPTSGRFYAFGAWVSTAWENGGANDVTLTLPDGSSITLTTLELATTRHWELDGLGNVIGTKQRWDPSQMIFIGVISDQPFDWAKISSDSSISALNVDNVVFVGAPEPMTLTLLAIGGIVVLRRRIRRA